MKTEYKIGLVIVVLLGLYFGYLAIKVGPVELGQATAGLPATLQTVQQIAVGPQEIIVLFNQSNTCSSRIISTKASPILLAFATSTVSGMATSSAHLSLSNNGLVQAASTTVAYDGGLYGCGVVAALGYASTTITTVETN